MARKKNKSMKWQVEALLLPKLCIGQSRHEAKISAKEKGEMGTAGIYSWATDNTYKKHCIYFAEWSKKAYGCKTVEDALQYIQEYINIRTGQGLSAWTIKMEASAIAKMYGYTSAELKIITPERKRQNITRSRISCEHDKHISEKNHKDIIVFFQGCGLRRHELKALCSENILIDGEDVYIEVLKGKGGKRRTVEVLPEYKELIRSYHNDKKRQLVFEEIPQNLDIHSFRAYFACAWYTLLARPLDSLTKEQKYYCRSDLKGVVYDKRAMMKVSQLLGHNRINVIVSNYLWKMENMKND